MSQFGRFLCFCKFELRGIQTRLQHSSNRSYGAHCCAATQSGAKASGCLFLGCNSAATAGCSLVSCKANQAERKRIPRGPQASGCSIWAATKLQLCNEWLTFGLAPKHTPAEPTRAASQQVLTLHSSGNCVRGAAHFWAASQADSKRCASGP